MQTTHETLDDVRRGLRAQPKRLPCKYFYDERGSALFDRITETAEYYPTRAETEILRTHAAEIAALVGPEAALVDIGSSNCQKARILLQAMERPKHYAAVDVSREAMIDSCVRLHDYFPELRLWPVTADFTAKVSLPRAVVESRSVLLYFAGSTIGNFDPFAAVRLMMRFRKLAPQPALLIGVDLVKDRQTLERAYNDAQGYTAAFNLNVLHHLNRRLGPTFEPERFEHVAYFDEDHERIEMHLRSRCDQEVTVGDLRVHLRKGETIHTESSHKYTIAGFRALARMAGFRCERTWTDSAQRFSLHYLVSDRVRSENGKDC